MTKNTSTQIILGAMNLLAVSSPAYAEQMTHAAVTDKKIEALNVASLKSIESSWLKVPVMCKARGFNASPVPLEHKQVTSHIQNVYAAYGI